MLITKCNMESRSFVPQVVCLCKIDMCARLLLLLSSHGVGYSRDITLEAIPASCPRSAPVAASKIQQSGKNVEEVRSLV